MPRPIQAFIHLDALAHNLQIAKNHAMASQVYAVVKANAYGHGIERVYDAFKQGDGFALLDIAEAERLRALGWQGDILLLEGIFSLQDLADCHRLNLVLLCIVRIKLNGCSNFSTVIRMLNSIFLSK